MKIRKEKTRNRKDREEGEKKRNGKWLLGAIGKGTGVGLLVAWVFFQSPYGLIWMPVCVVLSVVRARTEEEQKDKEKEQQQFAEFLGFLKEALQVGYSFEQAIGEAKKGMLTTGKEDAFLEAVNRMQNKMQLGMSVEAAFSEWAEEALCEDIGDFAEVLFIAKRTGGAVQQVITNTERIIRDKQETMRYIRSVLHSKAYEATVMKGMPFAMLIYMQMFLPGFLEPLYHNLTGMCIMSAMLVLYFALCCVTDKVTSISV